MGELAPVADGAERVTRAAPTLAAELVGAPLTRRMTRHMTRDRHMN